MAAHSSFDDLLVVWQKEWESIHTKIRDHQSTPSPSSSSSSSSSSPPSGFQAELERSLPQELSEGCDDIKNKALQLTITASGDDTTPAGIQPFLEMLLACLTKQVQITEQFVSFCCQTKVRRRLTWQMLDELAVAVRSLVEEIIECRHLRDAKPHRTGLVMTVCDGIKTQMAVLLQFAAEGRSIAASDRRLIAESVRSQLDLVRDAMSEIEESVSLTADEAERAREQRIAEMEQQGHENIMWLGSTDSLSPDEAAVSSSSLKLVRVGSVVIEKFLQLFFADGDDKPASSSSSSAAACDAPLAYLEQFIDVAEELSRLTDDLVFTLEPPQDAGAVKEAAQSLFDAAGRAYAIMATSPESPLHQHPDKLQQLRIVEALLTATHSDIVKKINECRNVE